MVKVVSHFNAIKTAAIPVNVTAKLNSTRNFKRVCKQASIQKPKHCLSRTYQQTDHQKKKQSFSHQNNFQDIKHNSKQIKLKPFKTRKTTHLKPHRQRQIWWRSTYQWTPPIPNPCKGDLRLLLLLLLLKILRSQDGRSNCRGFRARNRVRSHILDQKKEKPTEKLGFSRKNQYKKATNEKKKKKKP